MNDRPTLLLVHAHPDDETLWTGGAIAHYARAGVRVVLVTCTLGEEGEVIPPELAQISRDYADQLGGYRVGELRAACEALGVAEQRFLGGTGRWRDSGMQWAEPGRAEALSATDSRAFVAGDLSTQVTQLRELLEEFRPQVVVTYGPDGGYGHPDHVRAHDITMAATADSPVDTLRVFHAVTSAAETRAGLKKLGQAENLPFRLPTLDDLPAGAGEEITTTLDIRPVLDAKLAALEAHRTQVATWHDSATGFRAYALSNSLAMPVLGWEYFVLARGNPAGCDHDLFGGRELS